MRETTSSEFVEWKLILEEEQTEETKQDYYLAQIAAMIHNFMEGFKKNPKQASIEDYLLKPKDGDKVSNVRGEGEGQSHVSVKGRAPIEPGPEAVLDPKWAKVNQNAKAVWAFRTAGGKR